MAIQVNIFEAGSVPTAQELATLINELNTTLDESVTLTGEQSITGVKTFLGSKLIKFKQSTSADKLGFTLYDYQGKEVGNFEYDNKNNFRLLALGNYVSAATQEVECNIGFKIYNKLQSAAYRLLCPLAGNAKNSIPSLTDTYTNFYMPLVFTNGAASVMADNNGKVDLSTLIGSGGGDTSDLATVATTGDYNDLLNKPILFSGNYNDLTNKPTLFSGSYGDLTDKPTLFSGDYNDLTNKPTIPTVPTISTNITNDATSDTKTTSPKAVKDFVEGKGYLTEHQDISGKADQTDLEALEDRVETLEQGGSGGGDTTQYSYLKLIPDLDAYTEAPVGEIVKFIGKTGKYTRGWDYEKVNSEPIIHTGDSYIEITSIEEGTRNNKLTAGSKLINTGTVIKRLYPSSGYDIYIGDDAPEVGDYVYLYNPSYTPANDFGIIQTVTSTDNGWSITYTSDAHPTWGGNMVLPLYTTPAVEFTIWIDADSGERYAGTPPSGRNNYTHFYCLEDGSHVGIYCSNKTATEDIGGAVSWQPIIHPTAPVSSGD